MNVFWRELQVRRKSTIIWSVSLVMLLAASMAKYSTLSSGTVDMQQIIEQFPAAIQALFGMQGLDITTVLGYYGVLVLYVSVMLSIHAGLMGADLLAREEIDKTAEFLYVKPMSRARVMWQKLAAGAVVLLVLNGVAFVGAIVAVAEYVDLQDVIVLLVLFQVAYALLQALWFTVGVCAAAYVQHAKYAASVVALGVVGSYVLYVVAKMQETSGLLHALSPFMYFDAVQVLNTESLRVGYVGAVVCTIAIGLAAAMFWQRRRDVW
ncbi:hypothetical protein EOL96_00780 [Candidatus Saccharibacteria bacterium]|nr:hypothetical protein [Candidatus Saccharibacteria bacterium]